MKKVGISVSMLIFLIVAIYIYLFNIYDLHILPEVNVSDIDSNTLLPIMANADKLGFDEIYVINLKARYERKVMMQKLENILNLKFKYINAITDKVPSKGCKESHLNVYKDAFENKYQKVLIFEDDVIVETKFSSLVNNIFQDFNKLSIDWDIIFLGHCHEIINNSTNIINNIYKSNQPRCTHSYAISYQGCKKMIEALEKSKIPIDMEIIENIKSNRINSYSIYPALTIQQSGNSDIAKNGFREYKEKLINPLIIDMNKILS